MLNNYTPYNEQETNDLKLIQETYLKMDNIYNRDNQTAHFTSSSWIINKEKTKVLMIYHNIYESINIPEYIASASNGFSFNPSSMYCNTSATISHVEDAYGSI